MIISDRCDRPVSGLLEKLREIRWLVLDVDGVLTDGGMHFSASGELYKRFNIQDGLGLTLLKNIGVSIAIITGRESEIVKRRMEDLGIQHVYQGVKRKYDALEALLKRENSALSEVMYMGDDLPDLKVMSTVKVSVAPSNAHVEARRIATWVTAAPGGQGAVREVCDALARAKGAYEHWIQTFLEHDGV